MTTNRDKEHDQAETLRLLKSLAEPNWLGHKEGAAVIDYLLLVGADMTTLVRASGRNAVSVVNHLHHLRRYHGLSVMEKSVLDHEEANLVSFHYFSATKDGVAAGDCDGPNTEAGAPPASSA